MERADQLLATEDDILSFVPEESRGTDFFFKLLVVSPSVIRGSPIFSEEILRHLVYPFIRALGRQDGGDQEFQRVPEIKSHPGCGIFLGQDVEHFGGGFSTVHSSLP
jgi:hypothetical protein